MSFTQLLISTSNPGKLREYVALLEALPVQLLSLRDVGLHSFDVEEPFPTLEENALHKARVYTRETGLLSLADDTGLFIDALDGRPGIYAARYSGPGATDEDRYQRILRELEGVPEGQRSARFACAVALVSANGPVEETARGTVEGHIGFLPGTGREGFGYDAIFVPEGFTRPLSDLPMAEKNHLSHRGNAITALLPALRRVLNQN